MTAFLYLQMFYKAARVEYHPLGVVSGSLRDRRKLPQLVSVASSCDCARCCLVQVGAIVPWNYPFHNVLNPLTAAVFAGDAIVIKVSATQEVAGRHSSFACDPAQHVCAGL